jgi:hypothetical protein
MPKPYPETKCDNLHVTEGKTSRLPVGRTKNVQDVRIKLAQNFAQRVGLQVGDNYFAATNCSKRGLPRSGT